MLGITVPHLACEIIAAHLEARLAMGFGRDPGLHPSRGRFVRA